jgi:hypothetical protein
MKRISKFGIIVTAMVSLALVTSQVRIKAEPDPEPQPAAAAWCVVLFGGAMLIGTVIIIRNCKPKYFCLEDHSEQPPKRWVGQASAKEASIEGWKVVSGPYNTPEEALGNCPNFTNEVQSASSASITAPGEIGIMNVGDREIFFEKSYDLTNWFSIGSIIDDPSNFAFYYTNAPGESNAFFRAYLRN